MRRALLGVDFLLSQVSWPPAMRAMRVWPQKAARQLMWIWLKLIGEPRDHRALLESSPWGILLHSQMLLLAQRRYWTLCILGLHEARAWHPSRWLEWVHPP